MMARLPSTPMSSVEKMCREMSERSSRSPRTLKAYRDTLQTLINIFQEEKREHVFPWEITAEDVAWLLEYYRTYSYQIATRRVYTSILRTWTKYYGNLAVENFEIRWPADVRPNADWLEIDQAIMLLKMDKSPVQELVVHCELCLGMRRIEVLRLKPKSFIDLGYDGPRGCYVDIQGKGPQGGKPRRVPYHRNTRVVLARYLKYRQSMIELVKARKPTAQVPESLLIWTLGNELKVYAEKGSGIDSMIKPLGEKIGYPQMSNHTLRRTFGRTMYRDHVEPATISKMLGHESIDQTLKYIGVDLDDMNTAMSAFTL